MGVGVTPAVEENFRRSVGLVVAVPIRDEHEVGRGADPDSAEADFDATDQIEAFRKNFSGLERAIAILVLEDDDGIPALSFWLARWVTKRLRDPEPATIIDRKGDGLAHVGFRCDQFRLKTGCERHARDEFLGRGIRDWSGLRRIRLQMPQHRAVMLARGERSNTCRRKSGRVSW